MLKLFRRERMKSSSEGNVKNYLIYAFGEILLIMIGILLALQINNWNQNRIERKKESKALTDLFEEFKLNKQRIEEKQNLRIDVVPELEKYINLLSKGEANHKEFKKFHSLEYKILPSLDTNCC